MPLNISFKQATALALNIHSNASYFLESRARRSVAGHFMLGSKQVNGESIKTNGVVYVFCGIIKCVVAYAAEAELGHYSSTQEKARFCA